MKKVLLIVLTLVALTASNCNKGNPQKGMGVTPDKIIVILHVSKDAVDIVSLKIECQNCDASALIPTVKYSAGAILNWKVNYTGFSADNSAKVTVVNFRDINDLSTPLSPFSTPATPIFDFPWTTNGPTAEQLSSPNRKGVYKYDVVVTWKEPKPVTTLLTNTYDPRVVFDD